VPRLAGEAGRTIVDRAVGLLAGRPCCRLADVIARYDPAPRRLT
jgi:hypothetical protein